MRLHVGCGDDYRDGYVNLDVRSGVGEVRADMRHLPYRDGVIEEIMALDCLEHVHDPEAALAEWHRVLQPGGILIVRVPNLHALASQIMYWGDKPGGQLDCLIRNIYGGRKWPGVDEHHWGWTPASLKDTLTEAGYTVMDNDLALNQTVKAVRQ